MALCFDDLLGDESDMGIPLNVEIPGSLFDLDNPSSDVIQTDTNKLSGKWPKKSPFHESDSGMSEDISSVGSPAESIDIGVPGVRMLDDLVDSLDFEPFCNGSDQDLADYFGTASPVSDEDCGNSSETLMPQQSVSDDSRPSSPEISSKSICGRRGRSKKSTIQPVPEPELPLPEADTSNQGVKTVKVLKVIKTAGSANTATEVLKALEDRNKKNAIQAKINREKKKQFIKSLEDEVSQLKQENGELKVENTNMKLRTKSLEEEVEYLRAVLANESSLSKLLGNIENVQNVKLKSSFVTRKRSADMDHDYSSNKRRKTSKQSTAGVCLHVDNDTVSLEFCSKCSQMAHCENA